MQNKDSMNGIRSRYQGVLIVVLLFLSFFSKAQLVKEQHISLQWEAVVQDGAGFQLLSFEGCAYSEHNMPLYTKRFRINSLVEDVELILKNAKYTPLTSSELAVYNALNVPEELPRSVLYRDRGVLYAYVYIPGIRLNPSNKNPEKLISSSYQLLALKDKRKSLTEKSVQVSTSSPLAQGDWFSVGVNKTGVYKLSYNDLEELGVPVSAIDPQYLQMYNDGGRMLPHMNLSDNWDRFPEIAIHIEGQDDGRFDKEDYVLFYGQSVDQIILDSISLRLDHEKHLYDELNHYYITVATTKGKRITNIPVYEGEADHVVSSFSDYAYIEDDSLNFIKSGCEWYGDEYGMQSSYTYLLNFPNIDKSSPVHLDANIITRSDRYSTFDITIGGNKLTIENPGLYSMSYDAVYAYRKDRQMTYYPSSDLQSVLMVYNKEAASVEPKAWLDYLKLNAVRLLKYTGGQFIYRYIDSLSVGSVLEYKIQNTTSSLVLWDITNADDVKEVNYNHSNGTISYKDEKKSKVYILYNVSSTYSPLLESRIPNQNLHAHEDVDMVIVSHSDFTAAANRLADFHRTHDGMVVKVVSPEVIYTEFSFGRKDISAIRNYLRMLYGKTNVEADRLKYVLLFGDGSYDPKGRIAEAADFVPCYQSQESLYPTSSFVSDDYYGLLDEGEGERCTGALDIGVGRFPVSDKNQAEQLVDKTIRYALTCEADNGVGVSNMADWRNTICFVADDEDGSGHLSDAEHLAKIVTEEYPLFNINKIYFDAYKQVSTAGGQRYPEVTNAINRQLEKGALILNYSGHGGEVGWAHERVLGIPDINNWDNQCNMPVFMTATCEFSRWDDPKHVSAGELVLLNAKGGGVALFTTTRLVYKTENRYLNTAFYDYVFKEGPFGNPCLGDIVRHSKNTNSSANSLNFCLLGDPALQLGIPKHEIKLVSINGKRIEDSATIGMDSLKALSKVTIEGEVLKNGSLFTDFNGVLNPVIYDKKSTQFTLQNDESSSYKEFEVQKNILYKGKVSVKAGKFSCEFIIPKDISYKYGYGKFSFYAQNGVEDAAGYMDKVVIGGVDEDAENDAAGPEVRLFLNNEKFVNGGLTAPDPVLIANITDSSGVNTVGNGIGHDIVAILDGKTSEAIVLNEYYEAALDDYQSGTIQYNLKGLSEGAHTLELKVWDVNNNSTQVTLDFIVADNKEIVLERVYNYPNPFTTSTAFMFEHNQPCCYLDVMIQVYTISGRLVRTIEQLTETKGYTVEPIYWDGKDDFGDRLAKGVYFYKIKVRTEDGKQTEKIQKMVIL